MSIYRTEKPVCVAVLKGLRSGPQIVWTRWMVGWMVGC